jgi:hypothetical protein
VSLWASYRSKWIGAAAARMTAERMRARSDRRMRRPRGHVARPLSNRLLGWRQHPACWWEQELVRRAGVRRHADCL